LILEDFITLLSEEFTATINPFGAELCSVKHKLSNCEFIWQASDIWPRHAPVLFPFVGRLNEFVYNYEGHPYSIEQHGFARESLFEVIFMTSQKVVLELKNNEYSFQRFPFEFLFKVSYTLDGNKLIMGFEIENLSKRLMPVSFGGHPAFNIQSPEDAYLEFDKDRELMSYQLTNGLISDSLELISDNTGKIQVTNETFKKDALIFKHLKSDYIILKSKSNTSSVSVGISNWPFLGIWSKPAANFVCIEPWQGIADKIGFNSDVSEKEGIIMLLSSDKIIKEFSMEFSI